MRKAKLFMLEFDWKLGPRIIEMIGVEKGEFTEDQLSSLRVSAFPESAHPRSAVAPIFAFAIDSYYCYCLFQTIPDETAPRGHQQISFVIATRCRYFPLYFRLLHSIVSTTQHKPSEVLQILADFLNKWRLEISKSDVLELPMLDGSFPVAVTKSTDIILSFTVDYSCPSHPTPYYMNDHFIGVDICSSLFVNKLRENDRLGDILYLWESIFLGEPILVYGATPSQASLAVLAIASMAYPSKLQQTMIPFIAVTDSRFQGLISEKEAILGVSNPIALEMAKDYPNVFRVGFTDQCGLEKPKKTCPGLTSMTNEDIRRMLYQNTTELMGVIRDTLAIGMKNAKKKIQIASDDLERKLSESKIQLLSSVRYFAVHLMKSPFFKLFIRGLVPRSQSYS